MSSPPPPSPPDLPPPSPGSAYVGPQSVVKKSKPVGLAVFSLVASLLGWLCCCLSIISLITSLRALGQARRGEAGGKLMAQIALLFSVLSVLLVLFGSVIGYKLMTFHDQNGVISKEGYLPAFEVRTGDCMQKPRSSPIFVKAIPCGLPHETEVFAMFDTSGPITKEAAVAQCAPAFKDYVGKAMEKSDLELTTVKIAESRFSLSGRIACLVGMKGGADTAGTLKRAKR